MQGEFGREVEGGATLVDEGRRKSSGIGERESGTESQTLISKYHNRNVSICNPLALVGNH